MVLSLLVSCDYPKFPNGAAPYKDWAKIASFSTHAAPQFDSITYHNSNTALNMAYLKTVL
jgi:hypothetical protein